MNAPPFREPGFYWVRVGSGVLAPVVAEWDDDAAVWRTTAEGGIEYGAHEVVLCSTRLVPPVNEPGTKP